MLKLLKYKGFFLILLVFLPQFLKAQVPSPIKDFSLRSKPEVESAEANLSKNIKSENPDDLSSLVANLDIEEKKISELLENDFEQETAILKLRLESLLKDFGYQKSLLEELSSQNARNSYSSFQDINELLSPFKDLETSFESLKDDFTVLISKYSESLASLDSKEEFWSKALKETSLDVLLKNRIRTQLSLIHKAKEKLKPLISNLLEVKDEISSSANSLKISLKNIKENNLAYLENLFSIEDRSFWSIDFWSGLDFLKKGSLKQVFNKNVSSLKEYLNRNSKALWLHLTFLLFWTLFIVRVRQTPFVKQAFPKLYDNPFVLIFSSALLPAYLIYPKPAQVFFTLVGFLLLPCLSVLFIDILDSSYRKFVLGISFVIGLELLRSFFRELVDLQIVFLLIQLFASSILSYQFSKFCFKKAKPEEKLDEDVSQLQLVDDNKEVVTPKSKSSFLWFLSHVSQFSLVAFAIILICLVLGFWNLGFFLEESIFGAIYAAILFYAAFELSKGGLLSFLLAPGVRELNFVSKNREGISSTSEIFIAAVFSVSWLRYVFTRAGWWEAFKNKIFWFFNLGVEIGDLFITVKGLLLSIFIFYLGLKISRFIRLVLAEDVYSRNDFDQGLKNTVDTSVHYLVLVVAIFAAISALGVGFQNIALIAGALSVGIGFGLQNIVNNFVSGLILLVERPVQVGDLILIGDTLGNVTRIGIRSCTVKTFDDADIIFPNATLVTERVVNWTHSSHRARISASVGVAYGTDVENCMKILAEGVKTLPFVLSHPEVVVLFDEFADSSLNFTVRVWVLNVNKRPEYKSQLLIAVEKVLRDNGIVIPFPQRDLHIIGEGSVANV